MLLRSRTKNVINNCDVNKRQARARPTRGACSRHLLTCRLYKKKKKKKFFCEGAMDTEKRASDKKSDYICRVGLNSAHNEKCPKQR